jgi:hypothetical protein
MGGHRSRAPHPARVGHNDKLSSKENEEKCALYIILYIERSLKISNL